MCSCEQDRMNIKLKQCNGWPLLAPNYLTALHWDTFGGLLGCREVAIVERLNCRAKKPLQRGGHIRDKAIIEIQPLQRGGCSRQVAIVQTIGFCRVQYPLQREVAIVKSWSLQRDGHFRQVAIAVVQRCLLYRRDCCRKIALVGRLLLLEF